MESYNFSQRIRRVLNMARDAALLRHHEYVGTEHILLGLIHDDDGVALAVLQHCNVDRQRLEQRVDETVPRGREEHLRSPDLPHTSRAKRVLEFATMESRDMHHSYVGTEHLLIGLLREDTSIGAQLLMEAGVRLEPARLETLRLLGNVDPGQVA